MYKMRALSFSALFLSLLALAACNGVKSEAKYPTGVNRENLGDANDIYAEPQGIFGEGGLDLLGRKKSEEDTNALGVNSFLWRASLDTVAFMPLASADPFGGVILTDWYASPDMPNERTKLNVFILDRQLRSDAIQVKVFRQVKRKNGNWEDASVSPDTGRQIEDAILLRARQMRVAQGGN